MIWIKNFLTLVSGIIAIAKEAKNEIGTFDSKEDLQTVGDAIKQCVALIKAARTDKENTTATAEENTTKTTEKNTDESKE